VKTKDLVTGRIPGGAGIIRPSEKENLGQKHVNQRGRYLLSNPDSSEFLESPNSLESKSTRIPRKESALYNFAECIRYEILKPLICGNLVYEKNPLGNKASQFEKEKLVLEKFRKIWGHFNLPFDKFQAIYSFQLNQADEFHFHFIIFQKGIPDNIVRPLCRYIRKQHSPNLELSHAEKYQFGKFKLKGLFYLTKKPVIDPDIPVSWTGYTNKALNRLKYLRQTQTGLLDALYHRLENEKNLIPVKTYQIGKPAYLKTYPDIDSYLRKHFMLFTGGLPKAAAVSSGNFFHITVFSEMPSRSYPDWQLFDTEYYREIRTILSRRHDEFSDRLYLSPELDRRLRYSGHPLQNQTPG